MFSKLMAAWRGRGVSVSATQTQSPHTDPRAFTQLVADRLRREFPDLDFQPIAPLQLEATHPGGEAIGLLLTRIHGFCVGNPAGADQALDEHLRVMAASIRDRLAPIDVSMVRLSLRLTDRIVSSPEGTTVSRVLVPGDDQGAGLSIVPVLDLGKTDRVIGTDALQKLGLSEDDVFRVGEAFHRTHAQPLHDVAPVPTPGEVGSLAEAYASARIVAHGDWAHIAHQMNGQLVVMVPFHELVLYVDGSSAAGIAALRTVGERTMRQHAYGFSDQLLRWTNTGWVMLR